MSSLKTTHRWAVAQQNPELEKELSAGLGIPGLVARIMVAHGITSIEEGQLFLTPSLDRDWADPLVIPGMVIVADRVERAIRSHERIAVFGDFDVDGITSTCLLTEALRAFGADVTPFIPHRFDEGYGLSRAALDRVNELARPQLIVTVDNGIAAKEEVSYLESLGIDLVVTDHHEPSDQVPQGVPLTDPKLEDEGPSRELAGAGVALKLVQVLGERLGKPSYWRSLIEVAALGTVSDMMPLTPDNRALVAEGIQQMRVTARPGYIALDALAKADLSSITADGLSFSLIPRLNAAGRMADPKLALDLLLARDPIEASALAAELEEINRQRREIEAELTRDAMAKVEETYDGGRAIVVGGEGWHEGVKGIVASRIVNRFHVPAILFSISDGVAKGSGRSVGSVDLFHAVEQCSDCLVRFGGHAGAVGVTCEASRLDEFRDRLEAVLAELPAEQFQDTEEVTAMVGLDELTVETVGALEALQPFGQGNKKPLFASRGVSMRNRACVGAGHSHLRFFATDGVGCVPAIMFRAPEAERLCECDGAVDLVFEVVNETWQGRTKVKLMVKDIIVREGGEDTASPAGVASEVASLADDSLRAAEPPAPVPAPQRIQDPALEGLEPGELTSELARRMIGDHELLPAQKAALDVLGAHRSCLAVMATGRGKSLIFYIHAAREAILEGTVSVFVYPLRALVADQAFHLQKTLGALGLATEVLTGETDAADRDAVFAGLADGAVDVVLTTPEFLAIHSARFAEAGRIGFVVVDEAHHAAEAKSGHRSAYGELPRIREELGQPTCLAVTATASDDAAREICGLLGIDEKDVVVDEACRPNLCIVDHRNLHDRESALVSLVSAGRKTIVYVTSRQQSVEVVRLLRHRLPDLASRISFYNAGLTREVRGRVERAFRSGELTCIVSTSAFGEGVNLPDVRDVVLYTLPFGEVEFNQMSGRAGRDGEEALVHLFFGGRDVRLNERILSSSAPERADLVALWRALVSLSRAAGGDFALDDDQVVAMAAACDPSRSIDPSEVESGLGVFEELGFLTVTGYGDARRVRMTPSPARMDLAQSVRYLEGLQGRDEFGGFCDWVLHCPQGELAAQVTRPISPSFGTVVGKV